MALTTPIVNQIVPFDATIDFSVTFNVIGGDQVTSNTIIITNASTSVEVYNHTTTSFAYSSLIPAGTLTNGTYYSVVIITHNVLSESSSESVPVSFYCFSTPLIAPYNFSSESTINNSNYTFEFQYSQTQSEAFQSYTVTLYNAGGIKLESSNLMYTGSSSVPLIFEYEFSGMATATSYKIGVVGVTLHGMPVTLNPVVFLVQYETPAVYSLIDLENNCDGGYVTVASNIQNIDGEIYPLPPTYISNSALDLRFDSAYVKWISGYEINGNFTMREWLRDISDTTTLFYQTDNYEMNSVKIMYNIGIEANDSVQKAYVSANVKSGGGNGGNSYFIFSNYITIPSSSDTVFVLLKRINNIYSLTLQNLGVI